MVYLVLQFRNCSLSSIDPVFELPIYLTIIYLEYFYKMLTQIHFPSASAAELLCIQTKKYEYYLGQKGNKGACLALRDSILRV